MHKRILYVGTAAVALLAACQATKPTTTTAKQPAIETLGTTPVPAGEFAYVYRKNNSSAPEYGTRPSVQEYLDLYTNFKLKVSHFDFALGRPHVIHQFQAEGDGSRAARPRHHPGV